MNLDAQYLYFMDDDQFEEEGRPGFRRRVVTGTNLELWFWRIKGGAEGSFLHRHEPEEQLGIVMRGTLDFRIGDPDDGTRHRGRSDEAQLKQMIEDHARLSGSERAQEILADWTRARGKFVKVFPNEYRRALKELAATQMKEAA